MNVIAAALNAFREYPKDDVNVEPCIEVGRGAIHL